MALKEYQIHIYPPKNRSITVRAGSDEVAIKKALKQWREDEKNPMWRIEMIDGEYTNMGKECYE